MTRRTAVHAGMWGLAAAVAGTLAGPALAQKSIEEFAQPALRDVSASVKVISKSDAELKKIGKGYVDAYKLGRQEIMCKEPDRVRFQGKKGLFTIRYITNGNRKLTEVATMRIRDVDDISKEPGKGDSISDLGVITPAWAKRVTARWLRTEQRDGKNLQVFTVFYPEEKRAKNTVWVDPATKTIVEKIAHHRAKKKPGFKKRLVYSDVKQINGVWMPQQVTLYNTDNKQAAVMRYESIKVNTGLEDKLFNF